MSSQPQEKISEDLRHCLQFLDFGSEYPGKDGAQWVEFHLMDVASIRARLEAALAKLEAQGKWVQLSYADGVMVYPDLEERRGAASEPPLDYERPGQVDSVLRGQEITEDGE